MKLSTAGLLPPSAQEKLGLTLTPWQQREFRSLGAVMRAATPVLPKALKNNGPSYLRWRREAIDGGPFKVPARGTQQQTPVAA
jgi:uncharacterized protein (DUF2236 family)